MVEKDYLRLVDTSMSRMEWRIVNDVQTDFTVTEHSSTQGEGFSKGDRGEGSRTVFHKLFTHSSLTHLLTYLRTHSEVLIGPVWC